MRRLLLVFILFVGCGEGAESQETLRQTRQERPARPPVQLEVLEVDPNFTPPALARERNAYNHHQQPVAIRVRVTNNDSRTYQTAFNLLTEEANLASEDQVTDSEADDWMSSSQLAPKGLFLQGHLLGQDEYRQAPVGVSEGVVTFAMAEGETPEALMIILTGIEMPGTEKPSWVVPLPRLRTLPRAA